MIAASQVGCRDHHVVQQIATLVSA